MRKLNKGLGYIATAAVAITIIIFTGNTDNAVAVALGGFAIISFFC